MNNNYSPKWMSFLASAICVSVFLGFFLALRETKAVATLSHPQTAKAWGLLSHFQVGEPSESAEKVLKGAESIRYATIPEIGQRDLVVRWKKGDHLLNLAFVNQQLTNAYELRIVRNAEGHVVRRDWQAIGPCAPTPEAWAL